MNNHIDTDLLEDYLDGKLDAKAMHFVERLSLEDPFVAEALEGLRHAPRRRQALSLLQKQLKDRIESKPVQRRLWGIGTYRLSVAATAAVLFVTASLVFWMQENNKRHKVPGKVDVTLAPVKPADTIQKTVIDKALVDASKNQIASNKKIYTPSPSVITARKGAGDINLLKSPAPAPALAPTEQTTVFYEKRVNADAAAVITDAAVKKVISGKVIGTDGLPIPGAVISDGKNRRIALTDVSGNFTISSDSLKAADKLLVSFLGFHTKEVIAKVNEPATITLTSDAASLESVVITAGGVSVKRKDQAKAAAPGAGSPEPAGGFPAFEKYLQQNNTLIQRIINKSVVLEFTINNKGIPENFRIIESLGKDIDDYAIELIKKGPAWNSRGNKNPVRYIVKF